MKKLYLPQTQIGAEVVRVMMNPQPFYDGRSRRYEWDARGQIGVVDIKDAAKYGPFRSREIVYVPETWQVIHYSTDEYGYVDGVTYLHVSRPAKEIVGPYWMLEYKADGRHDEDKDERGFPWRPASTMPQWAARHFARIIEVKAELTEDKWTWILRLEWVIETA